MKTFIFALGLLGAFSAVAASSNEGPYGRELDEEIQRLSIVNRTSSVASDLNATKSCKRQYKNFYKDNVLNISIGFGYGDTSPGNNVFDYYEYNALMNRLKRPCTPDTYLCGFSSDKKDKDLLRAIVEAPSGEQNYLVEIRVTHSSLSGRNDFNLSPENKARQQALCAQATNKFYGEVANGADVVIYSGHSRNGGGPDFCPAHLTSAQHVDYKWYEKNHPGMNLLTNAMKAAVAKGTPNQVVGLFSCSSQLHFLNRLMAVNKTAGYLLTNRPINVEGDLDSFAALDSLLAQRCEDGFQHSFSDRLNATSWHNFFK